MSLAITKLQEAQKQAMANRPKIGDTARKVDSRREGLLGGVFSPVPAAGSDVPVL